MRWAVVGLVCAALFAALPASALAQTNGQLAVVLGNELVAVNVDGSAPRSLYKPEGGGAITGPAWSPDGNRIAFSYQGKITVFDVATREAKTWTAPPAGAEDVDAAWLADGDGDAANDSIGFRRVTRGPLGTETHELMKVSPGRKEVSFGELEPGLTAFALAPTFDRHAYRLGTVLAWNGGLLDVSSFTDDTPAWSWGGGSLAYVELGSDLPMYPWSAGLRVANVGGDQSNYAVASPPVAKPRWAPTSDRLAFLRAGEVWTVPARKDADAARVPGVTGATAVDWQPCTSATAIGCESVLPPRCEAFAAQVTTQVDQPVALPVVPCPDPAGRPTHVQIVSAGEHGSVSGTVYTPRPGFVGQDSVTYRVSNGAAQSELVKVTVNVVPRPVASGPVPQAARSVPTAAPFLSLSVRPRLNRKRSALARLSCDQACSFRVRLEGKLRKKNKKVKGKAVKRTLAAGRGVTVRLRLPAKPKGALKTAYITGTVRGEGGAARRVRLPVSVRRR
jgi:hypothetical protein